MKKKKYFSHFLRSYTLYVLVFKGKGKESINTVFVRDGLLYIYYVFVVFLRNEMKLYCI